MSNLYNGYIQDKLFKPTNRVFDMNTLAYVFDDNTGVVTIDTDYSGKTYDLVVRAWLDGYREYKELDYTIRVIEPVYESAVIDVEEMNEASILIDTVGTFESNNQNIEDFTDTLKDELSTNIGVNKDYIVIIPVIEIIDNVQVVTSFEIVLKVNVLDSTPPSEYLVSVKQELENSSSSTNTNIQTNTGISIDSSSANVNTPVILNYSTSIQLQYDDATLDIFAW